MSGSLKVTVAGLEFYGQGQHDLVIGPDGFTGWDDGVDMRLEKTVRPQAHGAFNLPGYQDGRVVALTGHALAESNRYLRSIRNRFTGTLADGDEGQVIVDRDGDIQWANGRLATKPMFTEIGGNDIASFQMQLWFPDARKYGKARDFVRTNGTVSAFHRGNTKAYPTIVARGSAANGYRINGPGGLQYRVSRALVTGIPHRIEFNDGGLRVNGIRVSTGVDQGDVWPVPSGLPVDFDINVISGGTVEGTVTVTDTYI